MRTGSGSEWPLVGRDEQVRQALAAFEDNAEFQGVVLVGSDGTGKSRLARAVAETVESRGLTVRCVLGTETNKAEPLGAFYWLAIPDAVDNPATMLAVARRTLEQKKNLVIVVDDAQLLDSLSATLINQLAARRSARLIVTIRSGDAVHDAVTALLKERLLLTVHVDAFTREQTGALANAVLGDTVEPRLIDELYNRSAGNLLALRGLLSASRDSGVLVRTEDGWQLRGPLRANQDLYDLLEFRLRSLTPEELEVVEVLATAELLDWEVLREICEADAVARIERRGLIRLVVDGSHTVAQLSPPVLGEAVTRQVGVVRSRQLNGLLAQGFRNLLQARARRSKLRDVRGQIRLARFVVRSDLPPDLAEIIEAAASALAMSNVDVGEELARFALDRGGGPPAAMVLAEALSWQRRGHEAEAVLVDVDLDDADEWLITRWGCLRAANLFWICGQAEAARRVLGDVKNRIPSAAGVHRAIEALTVSIGLFSGEIETTLETGLALCASDELPIATVWAAISTSGALAAAGRFGEVHRISDAGLRAAALCESGPQRLAIGMAEVLAATAAGDYSAAERVRDRCAAMAAGVPIAEGMVDAMLGFVQLGRGALPSACAAFDRSISALSQGFPSPLVVLVAARHAQAEGARGNCEAAAAALRTAEKAYGPHAAVLLPDLELALAWERVSAGQTTDAQIHAVRAAQIAARSGMHAMEMFALHTAIRFGDSSHATRLEELARTLNTPLAEAVHTHARGLANHDGDLLDVAACRLADLGAVALAADASAQAAYAHAREGHRGKQVESSASAYGLACQCGMRTPAVAAAARPLPLSGREREIAMLVAAGWPNREIADKLIVSVRTVEGHLYRIFSKLGINNRAELVHLLCRHKSG